MNNNNNNYPLISMDDITIEIQNQNQKHNNPFYKSVYIFRREMNWRKSLNELIEIENFFLEGLNWTLYFIHPKLDNQQKKPFISIYCSCNNKRLIKNINIRLTIHIVCRNKTKTTYHNARIISNMFRVDFDCIDQESLGDYFVIPKENSDCQQQLNVFITELEILKIDKISTRRRRLKSC